MSIDIEKLAVQELIDLNRRVVRRLQYLHSLKTRSQLDRFEVGDRVGFQSEGKMVEGVVVRVNRKTLSIRTKEAHWKIHPRFLTRQTSPVSSFPNKRSPIDHFLPQIDRSKWKLQESAVDWLFHFMYVQYVAICCLCSWTAVFARSLSARRSGHRTTKLTSVAIALGENLAGRWIGGDFSLFVCSTNAILGARRPIH